MKKNRVACVLLCAALTANALAESREEVRKKFEEAVQTCTGPDQKITHRSDIVKIRPDTEKPTPEEEVELKRLLEKSGGYDPAKPNRLAPVVLKVLRSKVLWTFHIEPADSPAAAQTKICLEQAMASQDMLAAFE